MRRSTDESSRAGLHGDVDRYQLMLGTLRGGDQVEGSKASSDGDAFGARSDVGDDATCGACNV